MSDQLSPSNPSSASTVRWAPLSPLESTLINQNQQLKSENEELQKQNETHKARIRQLEFELKLNTDLLQAAKQEIETVWKKKVDDLIQQNESLTREQQIQKDRIVELETTNAQLLRDIQDLQTRVHQQEAQINEQKQQINEQKQQINEQKKLTNEQRRLIKQHDQRFRNLEQQISIVNSTLTLYEFLDLLDRHFIRQVYGAKHVGLTHLNDLLKANVDGQLSPEQKTRFRDVCTNLDLRSTVLPTTRKVQEAIRSFKNVRHQLVHSQHQMDRDMASLCKMSDQLCDHLGGDVETWKLRGRALIALTFKALGEKPFERDQALSVSEDEEEF